MLAMQRFSLSAENVALGKSTLMYDDGNNGGRAVNGDRNCEQSTVFPSRECIAFIFAQ